MYKKYFLLLLLIPFYTTAKATNTVTSKSSSLTIKTSHIDTNASQIFSMKELAEAVEQINLLAKAIANDSCPKPTSLKIKDFCGTIVENKDVEEKYSNIFAYSYEKDLWELACVGFDEPFEVAKAKIKKMWDKYKTLFVCEEQGSILKFSLNVSKTSFLDTMVSTYDLDINFIDPTDGKNLLDYFIGRYTDSKQNNGINHTKTKIMKGNIDLIVALGGKSNK